MKHYFRLFLDINKKEGPYGVAHLGQLNNKCHMTACALLTCLIW